MKMNIECGVGVSEELIDQLIIMYETIQQRQESILEINASIYESVMGDYKSRTIMYFENNSIVCYASGKSQESIVKNTRISMLCSLIDNKNKHHYMMKNRIVA